jgi:PQQ-dependent dehydrogenase (methanol/ethanol family)
VAKTNVRRAFAPVVLALLLASGGNGTPLAQDAVSADAKQWVMPNANYAGWNYSPLNQINLENVRNLTVAWTLPLGITDSHEASPLVIGTTMYIVTPKPNYLYAVDLAKDGVIKWEYRPETPQGDLATKRACCGAQTRGLTYAQGKIIYNTLDGQVIALDAETGKVVWKTVNANLAVGETMSAMPLVIKDKVIVGVMGGERGVRGHVTAYTIDTGKMRWRYYSAGPNNEVGIGPRFKPFYPDDKIPNPALDSWYGDSWRQGGGSIWGWLTYDPELNIFYYGTSNCSPWNPDYRRQWGTVQLDDRSGLMGYRNNYCASILARDGESGELIWAYNVTPQDQWDLDEPSGGVLADLRINGVTRKALIKAARNGFFYVFDRATGELIREPWMFVYNDIMLGVDMKTGRARYRIEKMMFTDLADRKKYVPEADTVAVAWCPGIAARNWQNDAYSPRTGLLYTATLNRCQAQTVIKGEYVPGENYTLRRAIGGGGAEGGGAPAGAPATGRGAGAGRGGATAATTPPTTLPPFGAPPDRPAGELQANDPVAGKTVWSIHWEDGANNSPVMATGSDLLFQGGSDKGVFRAIDARSGKIVWTFRTGTNFRNSPITYIGPDGRQYVAVIGSQAPADSPVAHDADPDAEGRFRRAGSILYVFALPAADRGRE